MSQARGRILISRSFREKGLHKNTVEKILSHLSSISKSQGAEAADERAEELISIIEKANTEADILLSLMQMKM